MNVETAGADFFDVATEEEVAVPAEFGSLRTDRNST